MKNNEIVIVYCLKCHLSGRMLYDSLLRYIEFASGFCCRKCKGEMEVFENLAVFYHFIEKRKENNQNEDSYGRKNSSAFK